MNTAQHDDATGSRAVRIPGSTDHAGQHLITVTLRWILPDLRRPPRQHPARSVLRRLPASGV